MVVGNVRVFSKLSVVVNVYVPAVRIAGPEKLATLIFDVVFIAVATVHDSELVIQETQSPGYGPTHVSLAKRMSGWKGTYQT